jgi:anti-anti-sigma factor
MSDSTLDYSVAEHDKICLVTINETKIDTLVAPGLKTELLKLIAGGWKYVILNLEKVESIDSSGLGAVTFGKRQMNDVGGILGLCCMQNKVLTMMKITKLDRVFSIYENAEEGLSRITLE